jgi:hypothetical protein
LYECLRCSAQRRRARSKTMNLDGNNWFEKRELFDRRTKEFSL